MTDKRIEVLEMIANDAREDAAKFDGQPFNGKTVAEYFGNHGAAISALCQILKSVLLDRAAELPLERDGGDGAFDLPDSIKEALNSGDGTYRP